MAQIGHDGEGFAFDNETPRHQVWLEPFSLASRLVTNEEWLAFMADRGYARPELWLSEGWAKVQAEGWDAPLYWERDGSAWMRFSHRGLLPLDLAAPVSHVSYFEADAYARWKGARLPREEEWEVAVGTHRGPDGAFLEDRHFDPRPAVVHEGLNSALGDVWEWSASPYVAYPGFRPPDDPSLSEYNAKFMCNQMVLRGGSCATPAAQARPGYRNFFPPESRWQFSGVRLARDGRGEQHE